MENTQGKKPAEWFMQLKEPYRSEAIANIDEGFVNYQLYPKSLENALFFSFSWTNVAQDSDYWLKIAVSIGAGETTYLEPENVSLINEVNNTQEPEQQNQKWSEKIDEIVDKHVVQKLKPEPIELRPEELVSGEVYTLQDDTKRKWIFNFHEKKINYLYYHKMISPNDNRFSCGCVTWVESDKIYHATPEEKALLLGEEQTDWKAKFEELKDKYTKLESYNDELTDRINKTESQNNQEKVYFYSEDAQYYCSDLLQVALDNSDNICEIYEAVCIGKKKSVLVNE